MKTKIVKIIAKLVTIYTNILEKRWHRLMERSRKVGKRKDKVIDWFCETFIASKEK